MRFAKAIEGFVLCREAEGVRPATIVSYRQHLEIAAGHFGPDRDVAEIGRQDVVAFLAWLRTGYEPTRFSGSTEPLSPKTVRNVYTTLSGFWTWLERELEIPHVVRRIKPPRFNEPAIMPLRREEVKALLDVCSETQPYTHGRSGQRTTAARRTAKRDRAILLTLVDTGLRASELCGLNVGDVDTERGSVRIVERRGNPGPKGGGERYARIGRSARSSVWLMLAERGVDGEDSQAALFVTMTGRRLGRDALRHLVRSLGERAGVENCHPHRFRHTFAINYLRNGGDIFTLQDLLGHKSLKMVKRYLHLAQVDVAEAHRRASPVDRWEL